jgi:hypothetical protein
MIHTSRQLKALVRNMAKGDSNKAQVIIRNYAMERFLERLSLSRDLSARHWAYPGEPGKGMRDPFFSAGSG